MSTSEGPLTVTCYRHGSKAAPVVCRRCERPICTDCMVSAPVGWQCPACVKQDGTKVRHMRDLPSGGAAPRPPVTLVLVAASVVVFVLGALGGGDLLTGGQGTTARDLALDAPDVVDGDWWRLVTSGFVHFGLLHLGFNMVLLYRLGSLLEARWGSARFAALYLAALLGGSVGVLALSPHALTGGASGAVFGLMGAALVGRDRSRYADPIEAGLGGLIAINLVITFALPGISVGGHLGGLLTGAALGLLLRFDRTPRGVASGAACAAAACALAYAGLVLASAA